MSAPTITETILDVAANRDRLAHLPCAIELEQPDQPTHALCGHPLIGIDAPRDAPHCPGCEGRMERGGGPLAAIVRVLRCDQHPVGAQA